jgi:hypothetical protein
MEGEIHPFWANLTKGSKIQSDSMSYKPSFKKPIFLIR